MIGNAYKLIKFLLTQKPEQEFRLEKFRKKRTLQQNALYWELCSRVAEKLKKPRSEIHNQMLRDFGQFYYVAGQLVTTYLLDDEETERQTLLAKDFHVLPTASVALDKNGKRRRAYVVLRGSRDYNTAEMNRLLDGMKQEAAQQGIYLKEVEFE